jgi:hypothetical protein
VEAQKFQAAIKSFCNRVTVKYQPAQRLHEAAVHVARQATATGCLDEVMHDLTVHGATTTPSRDRRVAMGGQIIHLRAESVILDDKFIITKALRAASSLAPVQILGTELAATTFLIECKGFIDECSIESLPKMAVEASLLEYRFTVQRFILHPYIQIASRDIRCYITRTSLHL